MSSSAPPRPRVDASAGRSITVLHVDTAIDWRGGQRQTLLLMEGLLARGHRPMVATRPRSALARRAAAVGIPVLAIDPIFSEWGPWTVLRLRRAIRRYRIDILHTESTHAVALAALAATGTSVRVVVSRRVVFPLRRNIGTRLKYSRGDRFIAVSEAAGRSLEVAGVPARQIDIVHDGLRPPGELTAVSPDVLREYGVPAGAPLVVMVTSLHEYKDPVTFVRSLALVREQVPSVHALLIGDGPIRREVESAIRELGLEEVVHLTGYRGDALSLVAAAQVACLTSRQEGLSGALIEAMSLGKPVVSTDSGGPADVLQHGVQGFLVPTGDAKAVASAVVRLLRDSELAARLGTAARERAAVFTVERMITGTLRAYDRLFDSDHDLRSGAVGE